MFEKVILSGDCNFGPENIATQKETEVDLLMMKLPNSFYSMEMYAVNFLLASL